MTQRGPRTADPQLLELDSERGAIRCAYHAVREAEAAVLMVGGSDGGLDGPAGALYPDLAGDLGARGVAALRLDFRIHVFPGPVEEGVYDVRCGLDFLAAQGARRVGLVGHSFGGAVVIEAGVRSAIVASVATLATQTAGAQRVAELAPKPLLLVHGLDDIRLPAECSRQLHQLAGEPKRIELLAGARHSLRQRREDVRRLLLDWFAETLPARKHDQPGSVPLP
jgi:dienelactone hydrolase